MTHHMKRVVLPFAALVGQEKLKKALILNAINPSLLGLLIRGERGTAKSTAVRALAELLPEIQVVMCPFSCSPEDPSLQCDMCNEKWQRCEELPCEKRKMRVVELPLGATEDRVVGSVDIERALREGIKALQPGILADVNRGVLYIDEVNLLDDHLVDILLDSAAMGVNTIEREGVSLSHPSRFILVGTMNPEEGELRPQLLDRFGLAVDINGAKEPEERVEIIKRVEEFEADPAQFCHRYENQQKKLRERIVKAEKLLPKVRVSEELLHKIAEICLSVGVDGHRADFLIARTAKSIAAYDRRIEVKKEDIKEAAEFVLLHRMRRKPFEEPPPFQQEVERIIGDEKQKQETEDQLDADTQQGEVQQDSRPDQDSGQSQQPGAEKVFGIGEQRKAKLEAKQDKKERLGSGRRAKTRSSHRGSYVKARVPEGKTSDIAVDATLRASIVRKGNLEIEQEDFREKVRERKVSSVIVFVVDASGSMGAMRRMEAAKGAVMALLEEAYQKRDKVAFVAFRREKADVLLPPTPSVQLAASYLKELPTGGKTPLPDGLYKGLETLKKEIRKDGNIIPIMVLVTDGKGNVPVRSSVRQEALSLAAEIKDRGINLVVIDSGNGLLNLGYSREIAETAGGQYHSLPELGADDIVNVLKPLRASLKTKDEEPS